MAFLCWPSRRESAFTSVSPQQPKPPIFRSEIKRVNTTAKLWNPKIYWTYRPLASTVPTANRAPASPPPQLWLPWEGEDMATILAVGQDEGLLSSRSAVLRKCNVEVITARPSEAREILVAQKFDLLVLCHTLSSDDMNDLVQLARQQRSDIQVLEVLRKTEFSWDRGPSGADGITASAPVTLVAKVTEMLSAHVRPC
jgi:hypothetical protein